MWRDSSHDRKRSNMSNSDQGLVCTSSISWLLVISRKRDFRLHAAGGRYPNSSSAEDGRCEASKKRSHNHGECDPENQLRKKTNLNIRRPEAHRSESRRQGVIVGTPTSADGKKHQDGHGNPRGVPVRQQRL